MLALVCLGADLIRQKRPKADPYNTSWTVICSLLCDPWCVYIGWSAYGALASSTYVPSYTPLGTTLTLPLPLIQLCQFQGARQAVSLICEFLYRKFDTNMLIHHVGFLVALACTPTGYTEGILSADGAYFFGGLSELSTIVLGWKLLINEWYTKPYSPTVMTMYQGTRYAFLGLFTGVRLVWWNLHALEMLQRVYTTPRTLSLGSRLLVTSLFVMTGLQLYWGGLIGRMVYREIVVPMMGAGETNKMETNKMETNKMETKKGESQTKEDNPVVNNTDEEMDDVEEGMETNVEEKLKSE